MDTAGRRGNSVQLETNVAERRGTWTSWRVVATDHSCLSVMMMMMMPKVGEIEKPIDSLLDGQGERQSDERVHVQTAP